jgi:hypothetical protein
MLTRRIFLQTTTLALAVPAANNVHAAFTAPASIRLQVITDPSCRDGRLFHRALPALAAPIDVDAGAYLQSIAADMEKHRCDRLLGLTRNSDFILLSQTAYEHGYRLVYQAQHQYADGSVRHIVTADRAVLDDAAGALAARGRNWPLALARAVPRLARSDGQEARAVTSAPASRPKDSQGFLLSWAFARGIPA